MIQGLRFLGKLVVVSSIQIMVIILGCSCRCILYCRLYFSSDWVFQSLNFSYSYSMEWEYW